ncbi:cadherin-related family member 4-like [Rhinophrynus dorsalis]
MFTLDQTEKSSSEPHKRKLSHMAKSDLASLLMEMDEQASVEARRKRRYKDARFRNKRPDTGRRGKDVRKFPDDTIYVPENTLPGSIIQIIQATDRDTGSNIIYKFPMDLVMFSINPDTGALILRKPLDYDNPDNHKAYTLIISATDGVHTTYYQVTVYIQNVDEPPICDPAISTGTGIALSVPETFPVLSTLYTILAKDPDEGDEVKFEMSFFSPETKTYFSLDVDTGIISTNANPLDYELDPKKFAITIKVSNKKANPMSCTGLITISLLNENDEAPIFLGLPVKPIEITENLASGSVIYVLRAKDRDIDDNVHYEFVNPSHGFFIGEDSGEIKISYPMDYEDTGIPHEQRLLVNAFDNDRVHITEAELIVRLIDVNDNYPLCDGYPNLIEVAETITANTILLSIMCSDKDLESPNNVLKYKLNKLDEFSAPKFALTDNKITIGPDGLDYDSVTFAGMQFKHTLLIEVSDSGTPSLTSTVTVIVRVTRVNEHQPDPLENIFHVLENSPVDSLVGTIKFQDHDWPFNNLKFTFAGGDFGNPAQFYIEPRTGIIKVLNTLDFETKNIYSVTVQAIDLNNDLEPDPLKQLKNFAVATINIINVNDEAPICSPAYYETIIYSTIKTSFLTLKCSDKDSPDKQLSYSIVSGNTNNRFTLQREDAGPPSLATTQNFQFTVFKGTQDPTVFQLLIEVTDELGGNKTLQLSTTATVIVHVVPWTTTIPTITTETTTKTVTTAVLFRTSYFWHPDNWFPAVITIAAVLFLLCVYGLAWCFFKDVPKCENLFPLCKGFQKPQHPSFSDKMTVDSRQKDLQSSNPKSEEKTTILPGNYAPPELFDGRAVDPEDIVDKGMQVQVITILPQADAPAGQSDRNPSPPGEPHQAAAPQLPQADLPQLPQGPVEEHRVDRE